MDLCFETDNTEGDCTNAHIEISKWNVASLQDTEHTYDCFEQTLESEYYNEISQGKPIINSIQSDDETENIKKKRKRIPHFVKQKLEKWLFKNQNYPYPSPEKKHRLSEKYNLSLKTINNFFMNHRKRKMHMSRYSMVAYIMIPISSLQLARNNINEPNHS